MSQIDTESNQPTILGQGWANYAPPGRMRSARVYYAAHGHVHVCKIFEVLF